MSASARESACDHAEFRGRGRRTVCGIAMQLVAAALCVAGVLHGSAQSAPESAPMIVGKPTVDANGVKYFPVKSVYQGWQQQIVRVLEPTHPAPGKPPRQLYVLPVDAGVDTLSSQWGDGLEQLRLLDVPNRFNMTLIAPSFNYEPWYGDNVNDPDRRMESFVVRDLVPFGDQFAPKGAAPQRLLIGFSKSGNGVLRLILRHPDIFRAAAAWDAPAETQSLSRFKLLSVNFGTQANFELYNIPNLVKEKAAIFRQQNRLWISGDQCMWTADMDQLNDQLTEAGIPHLWVAGPIRVHSWHSGWMEGAAAGLDTLTANAP